MKLSIIIPALNEEKCLPVLLEGIRKQSFKDYEIIVVDAGSQDQTPKIAENFGCHLVKKDEAFSNPARARNRGAAIAQGDLFLFIDADYQIDSFSFLEELITEFKKKNLEISVFPVFPRGQKIDFFFYKLYNLWVEITQGLLPHATGTILIKKEIHRQIKGFDDTIKLAEDHDYARRAAQKGRFGFLKTSPVFFSPRRLQEQGRLKTYSQYLLAGIYVLLFGPIRSDIFKYRFIDSLRKK